MLLNQIKKSLSSESQGLLWVMSAFLLLIATLSMTPYTSFCPKVMFSLLTIFAVISAYRWKMTGALAGTAALFAAYLVMSILTFPEHLLWDLGWMISLTSGVLLFTLTRADFFREIQEKSGQLEKEIEAQKGSYRELENEKRAQMELFEEKYAKLSSDLQQQEENMQSYQNLIDATTIETEKFLYQNQKLVDESLIFHRTTVQLEQEIQERKKTTSNYAELEKKSQAYLEEIDQFESVLEEKKEKYMALQAVLHAAKQRIQELEQGETEQSGDVEIFYEKENEKKQIKHFYDGLLNDYNSLRAHFEKMTSGDPEFEMKKREFEGKKMELSETKRQLVDLDRELFILRKEMQGKGISLHNSFV